MDLSDPLKGAHECEMDMGWFGGEHGRMEPVITNTPNMIAMLEDMILAASDGQTRDLSEGYEDLGPFRAKAPSDKTKTGSEKKDANRTVVVQVETSLDDAKKLKKEGNEKYKERKYDEVSVTLHSSLLYLSCLHLVLSSF